MGAGAKLRVRAVVWNWIARPLTDVSIAYEEAPTSKQKALVALFSPVLFLYYLMYQNAEGKLAAAAAAAAVRSQAYARCLPKHVI